MKIESNIRALLNATGKVVIADLGTFTSGQASAEVTEAGGVIAPPQAKVIFSEDTSELDSYSLTDYLVVSGQSNEQDAILEIEAFTKGIKNTVEASEKAGLGSLGYFQKGDYGLEFVPSDAGAVGGDSFGLPKINARPLVPVPISDNTPSPTGGGGDKLLLKAILIPLVLLSLVLVFFMINKDAYNSLLSYFGSPGTEVVDQPRDNGNNLNDNTKKDNGDNAKNDNTKKDDGNKSAINENDKADNSKVDNSKKPDAKADDSKPKNDVVTSSTSRFYIIIGSFSNQKAAQKAVNKCKKVGYPNAKILKMNGKIRVSVEDYAQKTEAMTKASKVGKDYPGAWVLAN